jgi:hypothetical protein
MDDTNAMDVTMSVDIRSTDPGLEAEVAQAFTMYLRDFADQLPVIIGQYAAQRPAQLAQHLSSPWCAHAGMDKASAAKLLAVAPAAHLQMLSGQPATANVLMQLTQKLSSDSSLAALLTGACIV